MEIEISAKVDNLPQLKEKLLALGAKKTGDKHQFDVYLSPPHKSFFKTPHYLRVRQDLLNNKNSFEYIICEKGLGDSSACEENEVEIGDGWALLNILHRLGFKEICKVEKKRESFKLEQFEIVLDRVKKLGDFIEVEMEGKMEDEKGYSEKIRKLLSKLGVKKEQFVIDGGYVELMTGTSARDWKK